jgi:hypothetical protein
MSYARHIAPKRNRIKTALGMALMLSLLATALPAVIGLGLTAGVLFGWLSRGRTKT